MLLMLLLKVTEVTTEHKKWPKISNNSIKSSFSDQREEKNPLAIDRSPLEELEGSLRSGLYLLVVR